ncbi:MAG: MBL fold metallo-hydrolase [Actinobacteria bacterium]|uniref:Unannotated protein n=1 Tax=freshwater metagenome TaxID=449393 RepID=A0A6J7EDX1_9ZZZZ|nr:MBL fold metallo-hydrolase [Actinomycetota bacterium]
MSHALEVESLGEGIHRLAIPTPFLVGRVNVYLLEGPPLTLIDTGPNSGTSLDALQLSLREVGHEMEDIEVVVLTHQHVDHVGLARIVSQRAGAQVIMPAALGPYLSDWKASAELDDELAAKVMETNGLGSGVTQAVKQVARAYRAFGDSARCDHPVSDGDQISIAGRDFTAHLRPGHSPTDMIFVEASTGLMIGGDHLLPKVSSNPVLSRRVDIDAPADTLERFRSLPAYVESLRATEKMDLGRILPGHGPVFEGHAQLIQERLRMHEDRAEKMFATLADGPKTALEIAVSIWGDIARAQPFLTFSEVIGHMDVLMDEGQVVTSPIDSSGTQRFQSA